MKRYQATTSGLDSRRPRFTRSGEDERSRFLATIAQIEPLTFPEMIGALPAELQTAGDWRLVIARHPQVVLWDELSEPAARLLARLFEAGQLTLQPCNSALYDLASRRIDLPAISSMRVSPLEECWLTCTIGLGPATGLCSDWIVGYGTSLPSN